MFLIIQQFNNKTHINGMNREMKVMKDKNKLFKYL